LPDVRLLFKGGETKPQRQSVNSAAPGNIQVLIRLSAASPEFAALARCFALFKGGSVLTKITIAIAAAFGCVIVQWADAAQKFLDYPVRKASEYAVHTERSGVTIGVQPIEDLGEQKAYFDAKLTTRGFIPVFVVIENASSTDSFLFDQTNIGYGGAFYNFSPNLGMNHVQENIAKKQLKSATLSSGQSVHGFLYVPVRLKGPREKVHLQVPITKVGTSQTFVLNLTF
jgi:hypothetical protein